MASSSNQESKATMASEQELAVTKPIINNEGGTNPEKASYRAKVRLLVGTEPGARTENGMLQKLTRPSRYFNPPKCSWPACNGYGENYDKGKKDKPKRRRKRCYICGDISHGGKRCKKVNACFICSKKGHLVIDCPSKNIKVDCTSTPCLKCGNTGHDMFSCTNGYDAEDLKVIKCYICKQLGHLCCVDKKSEGPRKASCYNCGQSGHFGLECTKLNEVANNLHPLCHKCGKGVHSKRKCKKAKSAAKDGAAAKAEKKSCKSRRRKNTKQTPTGNASNSQPNGVWWPPIFVGPYYGRPGSNVWLSPAAAAARKNPREQAGALPSRQHQHHQVGAQLVNSNDPLTRLPHQNWIPQIGTQNTQRPINQETGIMLPQTETRIPHNSYYPMFRTSDYQRGSHISQPHVNHQTKILVPQAESQAPQNSRGFVDPTSLPYSKHSLTTS